jgi:hypothetical protein
MICKKHEQLNLIYFLRDDQQLVKYILNIPEINPAPQSYNSSDIFNFTTTLYDTNTNEVGTIIGNTSSTTISAVKDIQINTYILSLPRGTMTFGFNIIYNEENKDFFTGGQVIILNFLYGSGEYQNANVKFASLLPVNNPNQTRILNIEFDD